MDLMIIFGYLCLSCYNCYPVGRKKGKRGRGRGEGGISICMELKN